MAVLQQRRLAKFRQQRPPTAVRRCTEKAAKREVGERTKQSEERNLKELGKPLGIRNDKRELKAVSLLQGL